MVLAIVLLSFLFMAMSSADLLQNPSFESPPTKIKANITTPFLLLTQANTIPSWSFNGTVRYVTSGLNISLPGNGHAVQLGQGGKINQTFKANGDSAPLGYLLTFTLAPGSEDCSRNSTAVNISIPGSSKVFNLERRYGKEMWESHAYLLWSLDDEINLEIQSASVDSNVTCAPVVDAFIIKRNGIPTWYGDTLLANGGFEEGPAFMRNSTEGILLNEEPDWLNSVLQQWSVIGTVKYIDSKHYSVPKGKAAIELVSGAPSGIQMNPPLTKGSTYTLDFMMGDANDSCKGDFVVYTQVGMTIQNFTMRSNGTGSAHKHSLTFKVESSPTPISFVSFNESQTSDHVFCGPVIDNVVLRSSYGLRSKLQNWVLFSCFIFTITIMQLAG